MLKKAKYSGINRRRFIKTTGLVAGSALLNPVIPIQAGSRTFETSFNAPGLLKSAKVPVLLPRTRSNSVAVKNFQAGFELHLNSLPGRVRVEIVPQSLSFGFGALEEKFESLADEASSQVVVGLINPTYSYRQSAAMQTDQTAFLGVSLGENIPRFGSEAKAYGSNTAHLSFMGVEANWLLGQWAATNLGKKALLAASFYDSGFDTLYAFQNGFEAAGGEIVGRLITHRLFGNNELDLLPELVNQTEPDLVFGSYHGQAAREFLTAYRETGLAGKLPLCGSSFLAGRTDLEGSFPGIITSSAWTENGQTEEFKAAFFRKYAKAPDEFALAGYEAALLATAYLANGDFAKVQVNTPRGELKLNPFGQFGSDRLSLYKTTLSSDTLVNSKTENLPVPESLYQSLSFLQAENKSGWLNAYSF